MKSNAMQNEIEIDRDDFLVALKPFRQFSTKNLQADALLFKEDSNLVISAFGIATEVPVTGKWLNEVRAPIGFFAKLARVLNSDDPVRMWLMDGRLHIGSLSIPCEVQAATGSEITVALDADFLTILKLRYEYSVDQIERAGLSKPLQYAESKLNSLIERSAVILSPINLPEVELKGFIQRWLQSGGGAA